MDIKKKKKNSDGHKNIKNTKNVNAKLNFKFQTSSFNKNININLHVSYMIEHMQF